MKQAFIFWPKKKQNNLDTSDRKGKAIVDVSGGKRLDLDLIKDEVAFIIHRGSLGSDIDKKIEERAAKMNELNIPFGVYCYSYAGTKEKAIDEAQKLIKYTSKYNPLFYVMDAEERIITHDTIKTFAEELRRCGAKKIGCYCANHLHDNYNYSDLQHLFDFTWIPRYSKNNDGTLEPEVRPKHFCDLWQYTSKGKIKGMKGYADMNIITGDGHDLDWFLDRGE